VDSLETQGSTPVYVFVCHVVSCRVVCLCVCVCVRACVCHREKRVCVYVIECLRHTSRVRLCAYFLLKDQYSLQIT